MTRGELEQKIAALLGGRAAEKLVFDELSTGAADDLAKATDIARGMVMRHGTDEGLGCIAFEPPPRPVPDLAAAMRPERNPVSDDTQQRIDAAIRALVRLRARHAHPCAASPGAGTQRACAAGEGNPGRG